MANWYTILTKTFFRIFKNAHWDASTYLWDDAILTWDAISDDAWHTKDTKNWYSK